MFPNTDPFPDPPRSADETSSGLVKTGPPEIEGRYHRDGLEARETISFHVELPRGAWGSFKPGQHVYLRWIDPPYTDEKGNGRNLTIASPPSELPVLSFATRKTGSAFKNCLDALPDGAPVGITGPLGRFTLPDDWESRSWNEPIVFVAWGIGMTPFRSMLLEALPRNAHVSFFLFTANRTVETAPFQNEIERLANEHKNLTLVRMVSQPSDPPSPDVEVGALTPDFLFEVLGIHARRGDYFIAGPPFLVESFERALVWKSTARDRIHTISFTGYPSPSEVLRAMKDNQTSVRLDVLFDELFPNPGILGSGNSPMAAGQVP
jgi:ferredoxin-NADP reductase